MPNAKQQEVIPRTIHKMIKDQVIFVALGKFKLPLSKRATAPELRASVAALMANTAFCPNSECGAGTTNCVPDLHLFEPSEYMEDVNNPPVVREDAELGPVSYTHLTLPPNREV